ncbi:hypothetical protein [Rappaport israeli]|uniref:hypothetical protein n=1 Tax=Rappaport israeli TaxID=1839807 RepID=UPI001178B5C1|nr:hypothetical protein [Rappaport israeli]
MRLAGNICPLWVCPETCRSMLSWVFSLIWLGRWSRRRMGRSGWGLLMENVGGLAGGVVVV